ncbi:hypothetical protein [Paraburkholderia oxyphila]|uniref:hypothetical protein n=1 Tax=Paraburkholderia oxyphila TaxID=614212 RepID=UPI0006939766|nr:hypothetical protein [Paraburkholderia oxyphila]
MNISNTSARISAICYVIWGILHLQAAHAVYVVGQSMSFSMAQGRVFQDAWNLLFFALAAIGIALTLNWRNSVWGYWINFVNIGVADTGFILFVVVPGHMGIWPGILGPVFWIVGLVFSTLGIASRQDGTVGTRTHGNDSLSQPQ